MLPVLIYLEVICILLWYKLNNGPMHVFNEQKRWKKGTSLIMTLSLNVAFKLSSYFKGLVHRNENSSISPLTTVKSVEVVSVLQLHTFDMFKRSWTRKCMDRLFCFVLWTAWDNIFVTRFTSSREICKLSDRMVWLCGMNPSNQQDHY